ncbi:peptidoglycan DD-metalloendopeptidase family protein [Pokkaliibacter sp. CJK22405]|uniref:peptidoglycan DD-metalloendopeptidase family protein n=1 Tax=Pokkaliibacter sp. CJK22405 TaxID=3384615 RepID=UPI00398473AF
MPFRARAKALGSGLMVSAVLALSACSTNSYYAPVDDVSRHGLTPAQVGYHIVSPGETLYSIAYRYGQDYQSLAARNSLSAPFAIYPGQALKLSGSADPGVVQTAPKVSVAQVSTPAPTVKRPKSVSTTASSQGKVKTTSSVKKPTVPSGGALTWGWPSSGKVTGSYSPNRNVSKGINIAGNVGSPVTAAADGVVVYAGNGLRGYVNLIIINHNQEFLSAYANNRRILVKEQQKVNRGDVIAEMGQSGDKDGMLYFEIRQDGQPVNPLSFLPKR